MNSIEAFSKACRYCAYQERTQQQVREKLSEWGLWDDAIEETIAKLIKENFINEERFAKAYASGKFRQLKWGRLKIKQGLKQHGLTDYCIKKGMAEIEDEAYVNTIEKLIHQKISTLKSEKSLLKRKQKLVAFLVSKGFERDIIFDLIKPHFD